ncbi:O-antigen ligase family protein [Dactylosporangium sucinum]|nr:O-antigen ligase family protein [Dactylosporangium sucinum]
MTSSTMAGQTRTAQAPPKPVAPDDLRIFKRKPKRNRPNAYRPSPDLLPVLVDEGTYASRRRHSHVDAASLLILIVVLIQLLPSRLVVPDLTSVGRPGLLVGLLLAVWWLLSKLHPRLAMVGPQPMRWAFVVYALSLLLSYAAGQFRGMPTLEANSADRALLGALAFMGIIFMTADGVPTRERLDDVQRVLVYCTAINSLLGILQFITKKDLTQNIVIPGLTLQGELVGLADRGGGGLIRVAGTTGHYIEFSVVMAFAVPLGIHYARYAARKVERRLFLLCTLVIAGSIPLALSRTGILAVAVAIVCMWPAWNWRFRFNVLVVTMGLLAVLSVVRPGLLGTLRSLFSNAEDDPSIKGRTEDYDVVFQYASERPWLGRGTGTFIPELYRYLDNQWLMTLMNNGYLGIAAMVVLHFAGVFLAIIAFRRAETEVDRHLCAAIASVPLVAALTGLTFDSFSFSTFVVVLGLQLGAAGAMWRFTHPARTTRGAAVGALNR